MDTSRSKAGGGTSGSNREHQLAASIPSLRSSSTGSSASAKSRLSLSARLALARIEDRRRQRNAGELPSGSTEGTSDASDVVVALADQVGYGGAAAYLSSLHAAPVLARERREEQIRREARRAVAGPAMPQSWTEAFSPLSERDVAGRNAAAAFEGRALPPRRRSAKSSVTTGEHPGPKYRWSASERRQISLTTRHFIDGSDRARDQFLPSLVDLSLARIASLLRSFDTLDQSNVKEITRCLPIHLIHRLVALAGREGRILPLTEASLQMLIFGDNKEDNESGSMGQRCATTSTEESTEDWDLASEDEVSPPLLDFSFAPLTLRAFRSLAGLRVERNVTLRKLCLAGTTIANLSPSLANVPNLEFLSLAGSYPNFASTHVRNSVGNSQSPINLRVLARATPRLQVLDLTLCTWIRSSASFEALDWWTAERSRRPAWPELKHLVVRQIPCFAPLQNELRSKTEEEMEIAWKPEMEQEHGILPALAWINEAHRVHFQRSASSGASISATTRRAAMRADIVQATDVWPGTPAHGLGAAVVPRATNTASPERYTDFEDWERERAKVLDALWGRTPNADASIEGAGSHSCEVYF